MKIEKIMSGKNKADILSQSIIRSATRKIMEDMDRDCSFTDILKQLVEQECISRNLSLDLVFEKARVPQGWNHNHLPSFTHIHRLSTVIVHLEDKAI